MPFGRRGTRADFAGAGEAAGLGAAPAVSAGAGSEVEGAETTGSGSPTGIFGRAGVGREVGASEGERTWATAGCARDAAA